MYTRRALPVTSVFIIMALLLATVGVGYGLWSKTLDIYGQVYTGNLDAVLSVEEVDQSADFDGLCPGLGGWSIGKDCDGDGVLDDDMEAVDPLTGKPKDVAECVAFLGEKDPQTMYVVITNGYPSFNCFVKYDVHNTGTIPINIHSPVYTNPDPVAIHFNGWPPECYVNDTQLDPATDLEPGDKAYCNLHIHVNQPAAENSYYEVAISIFGHQWNEEP